MRLFYSDQQYEKKEEEHNEDGTNVTQHDLWLTLNFSPKSALTKCERAF